MQKIKSISSLLNLLVTLENDEIIEVTVDMKNQRVYFKDNSFSIDYSQLEKDILEKLSFPELQSPAIPEIVLNKIREIKTGSYRNNLNFD